MLFDTFALNNISIISCYLPIYLTVERCQSCAKQFDLPSNNLSIFLYISSIWNLKITSARADTVLTVCSISILMNVVSITIKGQTCLCYFYIVIVYSSRNMYTSCRLVLCTINDVWTLGRLNDPDVTHA